MSHARAVLVTSCTLALLAALSESAGAALLSDSEKECRLPPDLQEARGHVLFQCSLDAAQNVVGVELLYASVDPEERRGPFLSALARCAREKACARGWPEAEGEPEARVRLASMHYFRPAPKGTPLVVREDGKLAPITWLVEMREQKIRLAEWIFERAGPHAAPRVGHHEVRGEGWTLKTDLNDPGDLLALHDGLDFAVRAFRAAFPGAPPVSGQQPLAILFFEKDSDFRRLAAFDGLEAAPTGLVGRYTSVERMIYAARGDKPRHIVARLMTHEAVHHLATHTFYSGGRKMPTWVSEGIASFIECMQAPGGGAIDVAALDRGPIEQGDKVWPRQADQFLETLREAADAGSLPRLADFMGTRGERDFYGEQVSLAYASAWLLVHYLVNAEAGRHRGAFQRWMGEGEDQGPDGLATAIGKPLADLDRELAAYLERLSPRGEASAAETRRPA